MPFSLVEHILGWFETFEQIFYFSHTIHTKCVDCSQIHWLGLLSKVPAHDIGRNPVKGHFSRYHGTFLYNSYSKYMFFLEFVQTSPMKMALKCTFERFLAFMSQKNEFRSVRNLPLRTMSEVYFLGVFLSFCFCDTKQTKCERFSQIDWPGLLFWTVSHELANKISYCAKTHQNDTFGDVNASSSRTFFFKTCFYKKSKFVEAHPEEYDMISHNRAD